MRLKLSLGLQDFRSLREGGYRYIDKTMYLHHLCTNGKCYFLSRPRRFGKSLMLTTLQEIYLGSKELFAGLWIEDKWDWSKKSPVVRISMKGISFADLGLQPALMRAMDEEAKKYQLELTDGSPGTKFKELIQHLYNRVGKAVILIDEYDAPILDYLGVNNAQAIENRGVLREFYTVLKETDALLEFVMLTGVTKFSKVGIFSGLNNLTDLTMSRESALMLGYTQEELETNFADKITEIADSEGYTHESLLSEIKRWYNGYRFEENASTVYNPWSVQSFFRERKFKNFWFETGTPTFLINLMRENGLYNPAGVPVPEAVFSSFEPDHIQPDTLLYQTGYLTIASRDEDGLYLLDYPNYEVKDSLEQHLFAAFSGFSVVEGLPFVIQIRNAFRSYDLPRMISLLETLFAGIPNELYAKLPPREAFFHAALHLAFDCMGLRLRSEESVAVGRTDMVVETAERIFVLEFKLDQSAAAALEQIAAKNYAQKFRHRGKPVIGVGINFSSATKNIEGWAEVEVA